MEKVTIADGVNAASPPTGPISGNAMVWAGAGCRASATGSGGTLTLAHTAATSQYTTGPRLTDTLPYRPGKRRACAVFVSSTTMTLNYRAAGVIMETAIGVDDSALDMLYNGGAHQIEQNGDGQALHSGILDAVDFTDGVWLMHWEEFLGTTTSSSYFAYAKDLTAATPPTANQWVTVPAGVMKTNASRTFSEPFLMGPFIKTGSADAGLSVDFEAIWLGYI